MGYKKYYSFLSKEHLDIVTKEVNNIFTSPSSTYRTNITHWPSNIVHDSKAVLIYDLTSSNSISYNLILKTCQEKLNKTPLYIMVYYWTIGSYIPWHNDDNFDSAGTLYLNENWDLNWGGLYNCINQEKIEIILPEYNLLVEQFDKMFHSTTPLSSLAPFRVTIQIFFKKD